MQAGPHEAQIAGPSTVRQRYVPRRPFVSADHRPAEFDGIFRVVLISTGSVASVRVPNIVGELSKVGTILSDTFSLTVLMPRTAISACKSWLQRLQRTFTPKMRWNERIATIAPHSPPATTETTRR